MDDKQLQALTNELAKNLKTPEDLSQFDRPLKKISVEAALNAELTHCAITMIPVPTDNAFCVCRTVIDSGVLLHVSHL